MPHEPTRQLDRTERWLHAVEDVTLSPAFAVRLPREAKLALPAGERPPLDRPPRV